MSGHEVENCACKLPACIPRKSDEDDARGSYLGDKCQPSEVLVLGEENPSLARREGDHLGIDRSGRLLCEGADVVARATEDSHDGEVEVFVCKESHGRLPRAWQHDHFMPDRVGGVAQRRLDVVPCETRVGIEKVGFRGAVCELPEDVLDRNSRATNHWLALEYCWVELNTVGRHGTDSKVSVPPLSREVETVR